MLRVLKLIKAEGWKMAAVMLIILFFGSFFIVRAFEPAEKELAKNFWWYFMVTITTIGYGDFFPVTTQGRLAMIVVMIFGIVSFTILASYISGAAGGILKKALEGKVNLKVKKHTVIIGYHSLTEDLVEELTGDETWDNDIVLCFSHDQCEQNPLQDHIDKVVRGDLSSDDVMKRACVSTASSVAVIGENDDQAIAIALAVEAAAPKNCHIVVALHNLDKNHGKIHKIDPRIECVPRVAYWIALGLQDPGSTNVIMRIMTKTDEGGACYKMPVPEDFKGAKFVDMLCFFKKTMDATLIGMADSMAFDANVRENPSSDTIIKGGMALYYIANTRITQSVEWDKIAAV